MGVCEGVGMGGGAMREGTGHNEELITEAGFGLLVYWAFGAEIGAYCLRV